MTLRVFLFSFLISACLAGMPGTRPLRAEMLDKVAAIVNDEVITQSELDQLLLTVYQQYRQAFAGEELVRKMNEARMTLLQQMIEDKLVYQESQRLKVTVSEEEIKERLEEFKGRFPNEDEFEKILARQGLTLTKLRERYREQIAIRKLQQYQVQSKVLVTHKDIEEYYQSHLADFTQPEAVEAKTITVRKSEEAVKAESEDPTAKKKAEDVLRRLYAGEDFETVAREASEDTMAAEGGNLGTIKRGDLVENLDEALFTLKPGEISPILETPMGYHIFRVEKKTEKKVLSLEEVRNKIRDYVYREKSRALFAEWLDTLKKNAYIAIR
ncbi:MAG: peptidylprolyl isomerase [Candidatus Omnitrophica bacterium]|nr:peptidylprolyl isomerase [Candidatus Omnitrophota bacterium]